VIEGTLTEKRDDSAQSVRLEFYVCISKYEEFTGGRFESTLQSMRFSEPALRQLAHVYYFQLRMICGELVENSRSGIGGAIVYRDDFEAWIVDSDKRFQSRGQFFLFIACGKNH
jgi:hypothetical protein